MAQVHTGTSTSPKLTILVAAWNESDNIEPFIRSYISLAYPNRELVLCAGGTDETYQKALAYTQGSVVVLQQFPGEGKQRALRKGFEHATGEIIVLTDADCLMDRDSLIKIIDPILRGESQVTSGHCRPKRSQISNSFVYYQYALQKKKEPLLSSIRSTEGLLGRNCAIQRIVLEEIGAFDEDVPIGTDSYLAKKVLRKGYQIRFVPQSMVETEFPTNGLDYIRQRARWERNAMIHNLRFRRYRQALKRLLLPLRGLAMFTLPFVGFWFSPYIFLVWISFFAYSFLIRVNCVYLLNKSYSYNSPSIYLKILPYLFLEWAAPTIGLLQLLHSRGREQW